MDIYIYIMFSYVFTNSFIFSHHFFNLWSSPSLKSQLLRHLPGEHGERRSNTWKCFMVQPSINVSWCFMGQFAAIYIIWWRFRIYKVYFWPGLHPLTVGHVARTETLPVRDDRKPYGHSFNYVKGYVEALGFSIKFPAICAIVKLQGMV